MTTDLIVKGTELRKAEHAASINAFLRQIMDDLRDQGVASEFAADSHTLDMLRENHELEREGWKRSMSATVALLRHAQMMIERAEGIIKNQETRISVLENIATTDELTGICNRRGFFDKFMQELDRCERGLSGGGLLILVDLDNFKMINDTFGHMAGDACLRLVARTLSENIRAMDTAARLGGDEFVLLLSDTTRTLAASRAQNLAWQLSNLSLGWYGDVIPVRASLGLKSYAKGETPEAIFSEADHQLYGMKASRNKKERA